MTLLLSSLPLGIKFHWTALALKPAATTSQSIDTVPTHATSIDA